MTFLPDPCPTPQMEKRRSLNKRERLIYAPMSGVGGIVYDKDAVYIDIAKPTQEEVSLMLVQFIDWLFNTIEYWK